MNIYQHFRPEEREFIDQVFHWKSQVETHYSAKLTDFLDPREQHILKLLIGENGEVQFKLFGGSANGERKRALLYPDYMSPVEDDFQICLFEIDYPRKFVTIEHRQVLGTLMSLGLKRGKFGDIVIDNDQVQFFAAKEIQAYLKNNLEAIGRAGIKLLEKELAKAIMTNELWVEQDFTVSSLRLDTVISGIYRLSRQKSLDLIQHGFVKVNWTLIENPAFTCDQGDLLSVRKYGRVKIVSLDGKTKKDKWRIIVGKQK